MLAHKLLSLDCVSVDILEVYIGRYLSVVQSYFVHFLYSVSVVV